MVRQKEVGFEPFGGYVVVKPIPKTKTDGGLHLPDSTDSLLEPPKARVVKVGPGEETETGHRREMPVKPGDVIYMWFPQYGAPVQIVLNGEDYLLVQARYICGVVRE